MLNTNKVLNKEWASLFEMILVFGLIALLYWVLSNGLGGILDKNKDTGRINVLREYMIYYDSIRQSLGQYPSAKVQGQWALRDLAKRIPADKALYDFGDGIQADGFYADANLKTLQELLVSTKVIGTPQSIKTGEQGEKMLIFTSPTAKKAVGCIKTFAPNDLASKDGDQITNDIDPKTPESHKNWDRIYFNGDMGVVTDAVRTACKDELPDPASL